MVKSDFTIGIPDNPRTPQDETVSINLSFGGEALLLLAAAAYIFYDRMLRPRVIDKLLGTFQPIDETQRLNEILAQIAVVAEADKVVLWTFHNGDVSTVGYHYAKASITNGWWRAGVDKRSEGFRNVPIGVLYGELRPLFENPESVQLICLDDAEGTGCYSYLSRVQINAMINRLVRIGNLPLGVISIQYVAEGSKALAIQNNITNQERSKLISKLVNQVNEIMKVRVIRPSKVKVWLGKMGVGKKN